MCELNCFCVASGKSLKAQNCRAQEHECEDSVGNHGSRGCSREFEVERFRSVDVRMHADGFHSLSTAVSADLESPSKASEF